MVSVTSADFINLILNADVKTKLLEIFKEYIDAIIDDKIRKLSKDGLNERYVVNVVNCASLSKLPLPKTKLVQLRQENEKMQSITANTTINEKRFRCFNHDFSEESFSSGDISLGTLTI